jgi:serine/threonine protein kinase
MLAGMLASHYRVESLLGAGGMGVVYEATDTRLGRRVALKVLHDENLSDAGMLARLEREARVLAALNHVSIAAIHGLEHHDNLTFLVLEYVPGETLADRLMRGALNVKEALGIAGQVAEALEAAHARGVIHRDLKPANIKLTPDGLVKVLDFGLAKALHPAAPDPEGATTAQKPTDLTHAGIVLGTVAYMSPEQASGKAVDQRADIWALGCVLFEMLSGKRTFTGASTTELLVSVLDREPDWTLLPPHTPEHPLSASTLPHEGSVGAACTTWPTSASNWKDAVPFDAGALEVRGTPVKVLDGVLMSTNIGAALFDISSTGDLAYAAGPVEDGHRTVHWVDWRGNESAALPLPPRSYP